MLRAVRYQESRVREKHTRDINKWVCSWLLILHRFLLLITRIQSLQTAPNHHSVDTRSSTWELTSRFMA